MTRASDTPSKSPVHIAQEWEDAFNRRDWRTFGDLLSDDVVFDASPQFEQKLHHGRDAAVESIRGRVDEAWSHLHEEVVEATEVAAGVVLLRLHVTAEGKTSGINLAADRWCVLYVEGDRITHYIYRADRAEALRAADLPAQQRDLVALARRGLKRLLRGSS